MSDEIQILQASDGRQLLDGSPEKVSYRARRLLAFECIAVD